MTAFASIEEANTFLAGEIDRPSTGSNVSLTIGSQLRAETYQLGEGRFTNSYDLQYDQAMLQPRIVVQQSGLRSIESSLGKRSVAAVSGGFFFLADKARSLPRQRALNLALSDGVVHSLPVADRETLLCRDGRLTARHLRSLGNLTMNGIDLTWAGSLTDYDADCRVYGNGNAVISHQPGGPAGSQRVFAEVSRYTPPILSRGIVDIGLRYDKSSMSLHSRTISTNGRVDIFKHDMVLRVSSRLLTDGEPVNVAIRSIDTEVLDEGLTGALSVGPMLRTEDFDAHPINTDLSLGGKPPFVARRMARLAVYMTEDDVTHLRLFDGRPGSELFQGVTPREAADIITAESAVRWGCFLDPGQTSKMCVQDLASGFRSNFGNRHYLRWPAKTDTQYEWVPDSGRPVASAIVLS